MFDLHAQSCVAIVGCGGKTSVVGALAQEFSSGKVLVSTTTKIMPQKEADVCLFTLQDCLAHVPRTGIQCLGVQNEQTGKLHSLPLDFLAEQTKNYDLLLLEADGSRLLPCKGWRDDEPVVPSFCTHTLGVVSIKALGLAATEQTVFQLSLFLQLTDLREGEIITPLALAKMIVGTRGLFQHASGKRLLFINQVESPAEKKAAIELIELIGRMQELQVAQVQNDNKVTIFMGSIQQKKVEKYGTL